MSSSSKEPAGRADVLAARRGDRGAFERLVQRHANAVCAVTTAILGDPTAGEEVAQEAFVAAWQTLGALRDADRFGAWVRGIARRRAQDALRYRLGRREVASEALGPLADPGPAPDDRLAGAEQEATLWAALDALDADHREVLVLYYREGCSVGQVAAQLELEEATVRKRMSRARERLRDGVEARLSERIARTAPRAAALAAAVGLAIAAAPARAGAFTALATKLGVAAAALSVLAAVGVAGTVSAWTRDLPAIPPAEAPAVLADTVDAPDAPAPAADGVPEHVRLAFLAAEDARFYEHGAVDVAAIGRAAANNLDGAALQGGSTITQQLAKRMLAEDGVQRRSVDRKLSEVLLAVQLERELPKDEILDRYLDGVYLGAGATGVAEAARVYFGARVEDLTLGQAAMMAGLPARPTDFSPLHDADAAARRRAYVLDRMVANGWATPEEAAAAKAEPVGRP